jgi:hypothetical protein
MINKQLSPHRHRGNLDPHCHGNLVHIAKIATLPYSPPRARGYVPGMGGSKVHSLLATTRRDGRTGR